MVVINMQKYPNCAGMLQTDLQRMVKKCLFCGAVFCIEGCESMPTQTFTTAEKLKR